MLVRCNFFGFRKSHLRFISFFFIVWTKPNSTSKACGCLDQHFGFLKYIRSVSQFFWRGCRRHPDNLVHSENFTLLLSFMIRLNSLSGPISFVGLLFWPRKRLSVEQNSNQMKSAVFRFLRHLQRYRFPLEEWAGEGCYSLFFPSFFVFCLRCCYDPRSLVCQSLLILSCVSGTI